MDEDEPAHRRWFQPPSALQAVAMVVALLFLGGAVGWVLGSGDIASDEADTVDVGFLQDMIVHHEQARDIAFEAIARADETSVRRFAEEVAFFQSREIGIMQALLTEWGYDLSVRPDDAMAWMGMAVPLDQMIGLATEEEMAALRAASGAEMDELFLDVMIRHHQGGVHMAEAAATTANDPRVQALAEAMATNQRLEIEEYRQLQEVYGFPVTG